jgi:integrase
MPPDGKHKGDLGSPDDIFQKYLEKIVPNGETLLKGAEQFCAAHEVIHKAKDAYYEKIKKTPLLFVISAWTTRYLRNNEFGHASVKDIQELMNEGIIPHSHSNDALFTLEEFVKLNHDLIINKIRCSRKWTLIKREILVIQYIDLIEWISKFTLGFVPIAEDPDRLKRIGRVIDYSTFVDFISHLDERSQLIAKLLYFGGSRTLEEVIALQINDVNFEKRTIKFADQVIPYPPHVFDLIKDVIKYRSEGPVFVGRQNNPINRTTVFRTFNEAAMKAGVKQISPAELTVNL